MSFLVSTMLAFALAATVLAAALFTGLFGGGPGGVAVGTGSPRPSSSFVQSSIQPSATATVAPITPAPSPTPPPQTGDTYTVQPGDSLSVIGDKVDVPWMQIAAANGIEGPDYIIVPGQVLIIPTAALPTSGADFHIVQTGDTITAIAEQYDVDPTNLADFNNIADWNSIRVGDRLYIPADPDATPLPLSS